MVGWRTKRTTRTAVRVKIEKVVDSEPSEKYTTELFGLKCGALFQDVLEKFPDQGTITSGGRRNAGV